MLFNRFAEEIQKNGLFKEGDTVVAAVSGGADSICLLHLLYRLQRIWKFSIICAHVHHGLREEADDDAAFVAACCDAWNIPFVLHKADVSLKAREEGVSIELAGRMVRYTFFASLKADAVLTAHNKNDAVESMFLHLIRGCGLEGLCGIPQKRKDGICRPLLRFSRAEIKAYLLEHQLKWREDKTNQDTQYTRNKIRKELIPKIEEINPSFLDTATRMIEVLQCENAFLQNSVNTEGIVYKEKNRIVFLIKELATLPEALQRRVVYSAFSCYTDVMQILHLLRASNGTRICLSGGWIAEREYSRISIYNKEEIIPEPVLLPEAGRIVFGQYAITAGEGGMMLAKREYLVRTRKEGDFFYPEGMGGKKKLKDFFIDMKIPKRLRDQIPILVSGNEIAAVGNMRRSRNFVPHNEQYISVSIEPIDNV